MADDLEGCWDVLLLKVAKQTDEITFNMPQNQHLTSKILYKD